MCVGVSVWLGWSSIRVAGMSFANLFHFLCAQHVSDINISIIRSLQLFCWITTLVVLFLVRCVLEFRCGWVGVVSNTHQTKNNTTNVVIQQNSRKLLMMDILISETCWVHKKWNKIASDIKLVFYSSNNRDVRTEKPAPPFTTINSWSHGITKLEEGGARGIEDSNLPDWRNFTKSKSVRKETRH